MLKIPIVLASDKNCVSQMYTTILSALSNKNRDTFYDVYCLIPNRFSKRIEKIFGKLARKYKNANITFIPMRNAFANLEMQISHITSPTYYRLKIAELLPQYDKAIYLDIDTVVLQDLTELYQTDLGENYIGGVHSAGYVIEENDLKEYYNSIGMPNMQYYINAGVILYNLKQIKKENITSKFLALVDNKYKFMDQDIINLVCYGKIKHLDFKYNVMTPYKHRFLDVPELCQQVYEFYGEDNFKKAITNPTIVHYASSIKPWHHRNIWLEEYWRYYAKKSPIIINSVPIMERLFLNQVEKYKSKKVVFWGASLFLKDLIQSKKIKKSKILGIVDKDNSKWGEKFGELEIHSPNDLKELKPEVIILAVKNYHMSVYPQVQKYIEENFPNIKLPPNPFDNKK